MTPTVSWIGPFLALGVAFLVLFADRRRPWSIWNLDLVVLLLVGAPHFFSYQYGAVGPFDHTGRAVTLGIALVYLVLRMVAVAFGRGGRVPESGAVLGLRGDRALLWALAALVLVRLGLTLGDHPGLVDAGEFSVIGADRLSHDPSGLYETALGAGSDLARYGPSLYVAYLPFELVFPWQGGNRGGIAAAAVFDLLAAGALWLVGRRLVTGERGRRLALALALGWFAYPYTFYALWEGFNDALVALLITCCLLTLGAPALRGAAAALAGAAKFVPLALVPLLAAGTGPPDGGTRRSLTAFGAAFVAVTLILFVPVVPDGGVRELYDVTVGFQAGRGGNHATIWELRDWDTLQAVLRGLAAALALAVAVVPRTRTAVTVAALGAAVICALQLTTTAWFPSYALWFTPLVLVALLGRAAASAAFARPS